MCTHGHQTMVTETSKTINFWGHFVYNMVIYWIAILFIGITFSVFLRRVKANNETTILLTCFAYNLYKLSDEHNFSLMASAFLKKGFTQTNVFVWLCTNHERVCLDIHRFCSFDNWLCDPMSTNWQLTLAVSNNVARRC